MPTLRTERLLLRPWMLDDLPELLPLIGAREVAATTLRIPHPYSVQDAEEFLTRQNEDQCRFAIIVHESKKLIGGTGLRLNRDHERAELGYWISVPYWGHGYATEAARATLRYGFDVLQLHRIYASHFANNPASGKVLGKIGMKHEGCLRQHLVKWGQALDLEHFGILRTDPQAR